MFVGFTVEMI